MAMFDGRSGRGGVSGQVGGRGFGDATPGKRSLVDGLAIPATNPAVATPAAAEAAAPGKRTLVDGLAKPTVATPAAAEAAAPGAAVADPHREDRMASSETAAAHQSAVAMGAAPE